MQAALYYQLQDTIHNPNTNHIGKMHDLTQQLELFQKDIIERTKSLITVDEQLNGKLIQQTALDAEQLNTLSNHFFSILQQICRDANLSTHTPIVQSSNLEAKRNKVARKK